MRDVPVQPDVASGDELVGVARDVRARRIVVRRKLEMSFRRASLEPAVSFGGNP